MVDQLDLFLSSASDDCEVRHNKKVTEEDLQKKHNKKYKQRILTPEEWECYRLIRYNSEILNRRTSQREIADKLGLKWNDDPKAHDHCTKVWTIIEHLNMSDEIEKVIISFNFEYWLGNKAETEVFLDKLWSDLMPRLKRYWTYLNKIKKNGQGKLLSAQLQPIDEDSQARQFVESFLGE